MRNLVLGLFFSSIAFSSAEAIEVVQYGTPSPLVHQPKEFLMPDFRPFPEPIIGISLDAKWLFDSGEPEVDVTVKAEGALPYLSGQITQTIGFVQLESSLKLRELAPGFLDVYKIGDPLYTF